MAAEAAGVYPALEDRPVKDTICLFDVDGTLTPARRTISPEMLQLLSQLRHKCAIGTVSPRYSRKAARSLTVHRLVALILPSSKSN